MSASPADVTNANVHSSASRNMSEEHLDDEKPTQEGQFVGATLSIEEGTTGREMSAAEEAQQQQQQVGGKAVPLSSSDPGTGNFDRSARPGSVYSRHSTNSRTSLRPNVVKTPQSSELYFSYKVSEDDDDDDDDNDDVKPQEAFRAAEVMMKWMTQRGMDPHYINLQRQWRDEAARMRISQLKQGKITSFFHNPEPETMEIDNDI